MKADAIWVAGVILAVLVIGLSVSFVTKFSFPTFQYAPPSEHFINTTGDVGPQVSNFMWTNLTIDLMAQAVVIFAAAIGCLAMLRATQTEDKEND